MRPGEGVVGCIFPQKNQHSGWQVCYSAPQQTKMHPLFIIIFKIPWRDILGFFEGAGKTALKEHLPQSFRQELHALQKNRSYTLMER